jgi:hypothetical protein
LETLAIFVGIPAAVIALVAGLVYGGSARRARRYRPGRPFEFTPVWFLAAPEQLHSGGVNGRAALSGGGHRALTDSPEQAATVAGQPATVGEQPATVADLTGGASDRW